MATWKLDAAHSEIKFKVKHLVISTITGHFNKFDATLESNNDDFTDAKINFEAEVDSIDTKNAHRDGHLKSPDFFDAATHPKISFASTSFTKKSDSAYVLVGDLTLKGITKSVTLDVTFNGIGKGFGHSNDIAAFEIVGSIDRQQFGLVWSAVTETGGLVVGDEVKLDILAELVKG